MSSEKSNTTGNTQIILKTNTNQNTESTNTVTDNKTQVIKSGDIVPVIAISTIIAVLMANIVIARKKKAN